jgi:hypothetical protein
MTNCRNKIFTALKYIDLDIQIQKSNSKLLKKLPAFCVKWLKVIIRQKEINKILTKYSNYKGVDFLPKILEELNIKVEIEGLENLPKTGNVFLSQTIRLDLLTG